jgi:hypothetical protein
MRGPPMLPLTLSDEFGDPNAVVFADRDNVAARHDLVVDEQIDRAAGRAIEIEDLTRHEAQDFLDRQLAAAEFGGKRAAERA